MLQVSIIIGRDFNERVRKKSFIITTLLMPLLMIGLMFAPMLIMKYSRGDEKQIAVIDDSGLIAPQLQSGEELVFQTTDLSTEAARKELTDKQLAELLTKGKTGTIRGFVKTGGGTFDAALTLDDQFKTSFVFEPRDTPRQGKRNKRK